MPPDTVTVFLAVYWCLFWLQIAAKHRCKIECVFMLFFFRLWRMPHAAAHLNDEDEDGHWPILIHSYCLVRSEFSTETSSSL